MKKRALISVSDKTGIIEMATELVSLGYEIISTGGTAKVLIESGIEVIGISDITGFPECLDGRVKTLHPAVHAGLLARRSIPEHMERLEELNINTIDIVIVNLYPFRATILKPDIDLAEAVENIDIGGPTMLRSAAKNYQDVIVLVDPSDYERTLGELREGSVSQETRFYLMYKVFNHTSVYDTLIADYLRKAQGISFPEEISFAYMKAQDLRYGENPHQNAVFYKEMLPIKGAISEAKQLHGKELSYNNINDANAALEILREHSEPTVVALKHMNPCGVGTADTVFKAYLRAYEADPVSIFGGIIACNRPIDKDTALEINKIFIEIIIAPSFTEEAFNILSEKKNIRLLELSSINASIPRDCYDMKKVLGGLLVQEYDTVLTDDIKVVTDKAPTNEQLNDMLFAMKIVKHSKSNAIAIAKDGKLLGVGAGQTNRIWAAEEAIARSGEEVRGAVMASDAFFPFSDCIEAAAKAGISCIIQPGGSVRDNESIDMCNKYNIAMVMTGIRHFKH